MNNIEKLLLLAGKKTKKKPAKAKKKPSKKPARSKKKPAKKKPAKRSKKKYSTKVENSWNDIYDHFVNKMSLGTTSRGFRLLQRIKFALEVDGYTFRGHGFSSTSLPASSTTVPVGAPRTNSSTHVVCNGSVCTLLRSRPPVGLGMDALIRLTEFLKSKQCYKFSVKPKDKSRKRKTGQNIVLPKPVTWHRLQKHGLVIEKVFDGDNNPLMETFRADGILAYSTDRKSFYSSNQEMCRRWLEGVDRMIDLCEKK